MNCNVNSNLNCAKRYAPMAIRGEGGRALRDMRRASLLS
jgi:hypothetical protein